MATFVTQWKWEEAFDKFGFGDGDGPNGTDFVASFIQSEGYTVVCDTYGLHNYLIFDVMKDGKSILPKNTDVGYDDPRKYLPSDLVEKLDEKFRYFFA
jgi:hypothetical protein